jgi:hypothetical protein
VLHKYERSELDCMPGWTGEANIPIWVRGTLQSNVENYALETSTAAAINQTLRESSLRSTQHVKLNTQQRIAGLETEGHNLIKVTILVFSGGTEENHRSNPSTKQCMNISAVHDRNSAYNFGLTPPNFRVCDTIMEFLTYAVFNGCVARMVTPSDKKLKY